MFWEVRTTGLSAAYAGTVALLAVPGVILCVLARKRPGSWRVGAARTLALLQLAVAAAWLTQQLAARWSVRTSLPLALCDLALPVSAAACWWRAPVLVELNYFWGLAGSLQGVLTPDLRVAYPRPEFFEFVVGHVAIVVAALYLVVGLRLYPRRGAVARTVGITAGYTALVGIVDAISGANYMFLRHLPATWSILSVLGPWPWYLLSAGVVAILLFVALDAPFRGRRVPVASPVDG